MTKISELTEDQIKAINWLFSFLTKSNDVEKQMPWQLRQLKRVKK